MRSFKIELFKVSFENKTSKAVCLERNNGESVSFGTLPTVASFVISNQHQFSKKEAAKVMSKATEFLLDK